MNSISLRDYFGPHQPELTQHLYNAKPLLGAVAALLSAAESKGVVLVVNPATGSLVSGQAYGGYRPQSCPIGAPNSAHKVGMAVDVYDPENALDNWLTDARLERFGLYREHPDHTDKWCHLTTRAPGSGKRTFIP